MIRNYIKIAWRNLLNNKSFSLINIIGLAVSMSVCLLIISIIADQKSYDQFHSNKDRIYRVLTVGKNNNSGMNDMASSAMPLAEELRKNYTGIEASATMMRGIGGDIIFNDKIASGGGYFADANLFNILDFKLAQGNPKTALQNPRSLVISEELSAQLFYNENPIGKIVKFTHTGINPMGVDNGNTEKDFGVFTITGILKPTEGKTHLPLKLLASLSTLPALVQDSVINCNPLDWNGVWDNYTYVLLQKNKSQSDLQQMLDRVSEAKFPKGMYNQYAFKAQPLDEITPSSPMGNMTHLSIPSVVLTVLGVLCLIVMLLACLNYTNLSVARSLTRAREVGIRKVSGATRTQIFGQFVAESVVMSLVALVFSIVILLFLEFLFSQLFINQYLKVSFPHSPKLYLIFVGFSVLVGLVAGLLPSIYISAFSPIQILKNLSGVKIFKRLTIRKVLLVVQFSVSLIFIISTALIYLQTNHILNFDYGFNQNNVINVKLFKPENYARFAQAVSTHKNVVAVAGCRYAPATGSNNSTIVFKSDNRKDSLQANYIDVDAKVFEVWGLKLVAGKNLPETPSSTGEQYMIINEKMVADFGYKTASQAIGQRIVADNKNVEIVGVVKDFQFLNVIDRIAPLMLRNNQSQFGYATIRISGQNPKETLSYLEETWKKVNPTTKFNYEFFDQQLLVTHVVLSNLANTLGYIAFLAVFIACLGLLGMATYTAQTRQKEIGVRKVLGSSAWQIIVLLSKHFMILLGIAIVIATPLAYFINNLWLEFFASRVSISPLVIGGSALILLIISSLVVLSQSWRAAQANPVESLKID
jgi:putative ABC transport system permease protein